VQQRAATCPVALGPTSLCERALVLSCNMWFQFPPPCVKELQGHHASHGPRPHLSAQEGSRAVTRPTAPDPAFLCGRARELQRVLWHRTPPPCSEGFRATTCPTASGPASLLGGLQSRHASRSTGPRLPAQRAPEPSHVPRHQTPPPSVGGLGAAVCPTTHGK
jgi:hypothetical protein